MSNPFVLALRQDPQRFFAELSTEEMKTMLEAAAATLEKRAKAGDGKAAHALQSLYRTLGNVEI